MNPTKFLILGRPRSRTAWAANFLTVPPRSRCLHEGLADVGADLARLRIRMSGLEAEVAGDADTGLIHDVDGLLEMFPDARLVVMVGGELSWRSWCAKTGVPARVSSEVDRAYSLARERLLGRAHFADCRAVTTDAGEAARLWEHCLPGHPFDHQRWGMLKDLNVQVIPASLMARLKLSNERNVP